MRILLIEDDLLLCTSLAYQLKEQSFLTDCCHNGEDAWHFIAQHAYDLILLDWMLPQKDGLTVIRQIRERGITTPVIFLTALGDLQNKIDGLDSGADDYLVKPFEFSELMARIRSIQRRPQKWNSNERITAGNIVLSPYNKLFTNGTQECTLTAKESCLLEFFMNNLNQTLPRELLLARVWGPDAPVEDGNLDNYIYFLRRRLKTFGSSVQIKTVRGIGYCMEEM